MQDDLCRASARMRRLAARSRRPRFNLREGSRELCAGVMVSMSSSQFQLAFNRQGAKQILQDFSLHPFDL
jgi:NADH:ubiquinone oxidoreductase subunit H